MTAGDHSCEISSVPEEINAAAIEDTGEAVAKRTANITLTKEEESIKYELKISEGELSEEEKGNMTDSMKKACGNKDIEKITIKATNAEDFNKMANGDIVSVGVSINVTRKKRGGCTNLRVFLILHYFKIYSFGSDIMHIQRQKLLALAIWI